MRQLRLRATDVMTGKAQLLTFGDGVCTTTDSPDSAPGTVFVSPGWLDIQVNGFAGIDLNAPAVQPGDVVSMTRRLWQEGVARYCPTVITQAGAQIERSLSVIAAACAQDSQVCASVAGIHLEGPYLSAVDGARGAHPREHVRVPDLDEFARFQATAAGAIRIVTLAPELPGALPFITALTRAGIVVAIGHTLADAATLARAVDAGATLSTHLGNGAPAQLPRHPNVIWDQLANDDLFASVIFDGHHLPRSMMRVFMRAKPAHKRILISDAVALARMPPGVYDSQIGGRVELFADGRLAQFGTPYLAGSASSLKDGVENAIHCAGEDIDGAIAAACQMAATNPAALLGLQAAADTRTVFARDTATGAIHVIATIVGGRVRWMNAPAAAAVATLTDAL